MACHLLFYSRMTAAFEAGIGSLAGITPQGAGEGLVSQSMTGTRSSSGQAPFVAAGATTSSEISTESFQTRWQSMLASIDTDVNGASRKGTGGDGGDSEQTPIGKSAAGTTQIKTSMPAAGKSQLVQQAQEAPSGDTGKAAAPDSSGMLASRLAWANRIATQIQEASTDSAKGDVQDAAGAGQRSSVSHPSPDRTAKQKETGNSNATVQAATQNGNPLAAIPAPVNAPIPQISVSGKSASALSTPNAFADLRTADEAGNSHSQNAQSYAHSGASTGTSKSPEAGTQQARDTETLAGQGRLATTHESQAEGPAVAGGSNFGVGSLPATVSQDDSANHLAAHTLSANASAAQNAAFPSTSAPVQAADLHAALPASQATAASSAGDAAIAASASSKSAAISESKKSVPGRSVSSSAQSAAHAISAAAAGPTAGAPLDAAAQARVLADVKGTTSTAGATSTGPAGSAAASASHDPFAALDSAASSSTPYWIHAGTRQAEAGYQDPSLGWVGVRAEVSGDGIHASLLPSSADAAQALSGHLAGLNTYLAEQHTPVATLTMAANPDAQPGYSAGQGAQQQTGQNDGQSPQGQFTASVTSSAPHASTADTNGASKQAASIEPNHSGSRYVSVMA